MNLLIQAAVKILLSALSFLNRKDWLTEDQAFAFFKALPISDTTITTITTLIAKEKSLVRTTRRNYKSDITKY